MVGGERIRFLLRFPDVIAIPGHDTRLWSRITQSSQQLTNTSVKRAVRDPACRGGARIEAVRSAESNSFGPNLVIILRNSLICTTNY